MFDKGRFVNQIFSVLIKIKLRKHMQRRRITIFQQNEGPMREGKGLVEVNKIIRG